MLRGFKDFIMRGNVIELAVAFVIGSAFVKVVSQFSDSFVLPLVQLLSGGGKVAGKFQATKDVAFDWGAFVNVVIGFVITAAVVYFIFVLPMNKLAERRARGQEPKPVVLSDEVLLLTEIRDALVAGDRGSDSGAPPVSARPRLR